MSRKYRVFVMDRKKFINNIKRVVIKIGSKALADGNKISFSSI